MKINSIMSIFAPKDVKFFPLMKETASIMVQASQHLQAFFACDDAEQRTELYKLIKEEESKGDKATGQIIKALNETFITPFDREDINALTDEMDDVIDGINRTAQKVLLYSPERFPECALLLVEIIHKGSLEIQAAVNELQNLKKTDEHFRRHYKKIKNLEESADHLYEIGIMNLFKEEKNTIELIKLKEIIMEMEKTVNKINKTGKVFKSIFVKYA